MRRILPLIIAAAPCIAHASSDLTLVGGLNLASQAQSDAGGTSVGIAPAAGGGIALRIGYLELGAMYLPRGSRLTSGGSFLEAFYHSLAAPVLLRFSPVEIASVAAGGYWSYLLGDAVRTRSGTVGGAGVGGSAPVPSDMSRHDAGLVFGTQLRLPISSAYSVVADFRYVFGLMDMNLSGETLYTRDIQLLAGFSFDL